MSEQIIDTHNGNDVTINLVEETLSDDSMAYSVDLRILSHGTDTIRMNCAHYSNAVVLFGTIVRQSVNIYAR